MNEKTHAWLIARFYIQYAQAAAKMGNPELGEAAFIKAAQIYGEERGRRMALRALRDGQPLNYASYIAYKEWQPTDPGFYEGTVVRYSPDYENHIARCPWAETFVEAGAPECGAVYCAQIDAALVRGFNPALKFDLLNPLIGHDCCRMIFREANLSEGALPQPINADTVQSFTYHCGHLFHVFAAVALAVFGSEGPNVYFAVFKQFEEKYGKELTGELIQAEKQDFSII